MLERPFTQQALVWGASIFLSSAAMAQDLAMPSGPVILTVSGDIAHTNVGDEAQFDLEMLDALERASFSSSTIWTEGKIAFEGVWLSTILSTVGAKGSTFRATALNEYSVDLPAEDALEGGAMLAVRMNGVEMSPRDKGPIWLVYPYDHDDKFRSEVTFARSVWQLYRLEVAP